MSVEYKTMNLDYQYMGMHGQDHIVQGFANVFNILDQKNDIVLPNAMTKTLMKAYARGILPAMLLEHNITLYAGVWHALEEQKDGLFVSGKILNDAPGGSQAISEVYQRILIGLSIGYEVISSYIKNNIRYLQELELYEVSLVKHPANQHAVITQFTKSLD